MSSRPRKIYVPYKRKYIGDGGGLLSPFPWEKLPFLPSLRSVAFWAAKRTYIPENERFMSELVSSGIMRDSEIPSPTPETVKVDSE